MDLFSAVPLDKDADTPLYQQLGEGILALIADGSLPAGSKLPPIRKLAAAYGVNNATVVTAYRYLEQKKAVYAQVGSGTYVSPIPLRQVPVPVQERRQAVPPLSGSINFANTALPAHLFPTQAFGQAFESLLKREGGDAFRYEDSRGYYPLREVLCRVLSTTGIRAVPEQIQVVSGAQQGIDIVAKAMMSYGDVVVLEKPTFYGAAGAFLSRGGRLLEIPLEKDGMDMERLEALLKLYHPKFIYMMSCFQTPTGISYSPAKKRRLLQLAEAYDTYIIEDDNLYDFYYTAERPTSLKALDYQNRVVYIKSFSKILMPGLRLGLVVLPKKIAAAVEEAKYTTDIASSSFLQKAADLYFRTMPWEAHREAMRHFGMEKYKKALIAAKMAGIRSFSPPEGGISLWISTPPHLTAEDLAKELLTEGVVVSPGSQFLLEHSESHAFRLCFTGVSDAELTLGLAKIGQILKKR